VKLSNPGSRSKFKVILFTLFFITFSALFAQTQSPLEAAQHKLNTVPEDDIPEPDVSVPFAPTVFSGDGKRFLCYELLITNMEPIPMRVHEIAVYADGPLPLLTQQGKSLATSLHQSGGKGADSKNQDVVVVGAGERAVDFIWIELPPNTPVPRILRDAITVQRTGEDKVLTIPLAPIPVGDSPRVLQPPLRGANWAAVNGPSPTSQHRTSLFVVNGTTYFTERFAIDWLRVDKNGSTSRGDRSDNRNYLCFGQNVYAVADGVVSGIKDGIPNGVPEANGKPADPRVPITLETVAGNEVILDIGDGLFAGYAHLQAGSLRVKVGDRVNAGDVLGLVGNSGNSTEPHLHFQVMNANSIPASQGIPYALQQFTLRFKGSWQGDDFKLSPLETPIVYRQEIPLEDEVVDFPQ
jgi:hypothetical protein